MLSKWLQSGFGQVLAPDPNAPAGDDGSGDGIWTIIAPDPNFDRPGGKSGSADGAMAEAEAEADAATATANSATASAALVEVECVHCGNMTPATASADTFMSTPPLGGLATPPPSQRPQPRGGRIPATPLSASLLSPPVLQSAAGGNARLADSVLSAARTTALAMSSPTFLWESRKIFFSLCAAGTLNVKKAARMQKILARDPSLAEARATAMGNLVYDGATPLHAASISDNTDAARILLGMGPEAGEGNNESESGPIHTHPKAANLVSLLDLQGRTALHVAAEHGRVDMVRLLKRVMACADPAGEAPVGPAAPTDLSGRTPLGWAVTSRSAAARRNEKDLELELFSPGDGSVCGVPTPAVDRAGCFGRHWRVENDGRADPAAAVADPDLSAWKAAGKVPALPFGHSEMPGWRVDMEDSLLHLYPLPFGVVAGKGNSSDTATRPAVGMFGVFDGHGDAGTISAFVARMLPRILIGMDQWEHYKGGGDLLTTMILDACPLVDERLLVAGGKGADAFPPPAPTDVGVVGSSLPPTKTGGTTGVFALVSEGEIVVGNVGDSRCILVQRAANEVCADGTADSGEISTKALSTDHKPNLPYERARVERSGLDVVAEVVSETETIHKIQRGPSDKIAVSRAFGDFDYKANADLPPEQQAIVCTPEVTVHHRDLARDLYLILACDGIWDVMSSDEAGAFVHKGMKRLMLEKDSAGQKKSSVVSETLPAVGDELIYECLKRGSRDNMSVLIISLAPVEGDDEGFDALSEKVEKSLNFADE